MNLALSDEQEFLREAARGALSRFKTLEAARGALDGQGAETGPVGQLTISLVCSTGAIVV